MIDAVHHVSYVVDDLDRVVRYLRESLGMQPTWLGGEERGVREAIFDIGGVEIQVKQPLQPDSDLGVFLRTHGPGVHHVAWRTSGLDELAVRLRETGSVLRDGPLPHRSGESSAAHRAATYRVLNIMAGSGHGLGERIQLVAEDAPGY